MFSHRRGIRLGGFLFVLFGSLACGGQVDSLADAVTTMPITDVVGTPGELLEERLEVIAAHVAEWRGAETIEVAKAAAEAAANHVVGPNGPGFGDRDGDGETRGPSDAGILPGLDGTPAGFALAALQAGAPACVLDDVLGGPWDEPADRWAIMESAIDDWRPEANTMPSLPSHPQRIVGWATFAIASDSLDVAHEYGAHAHLHVDTSQAALDC